MATKQKIIGLILKKQSYKDLKPIIAQIHKSNNQSIKTSIQAIQQVLTKQYNIESKLYALRFLKDCFEMGSKTFIKLTEENLLSIIVNIVIETTDEAVITRYAGSSFTKSTDINKFKSILFSFFKLAKQSLHKWATWLPNPEYHFKSAFVSLQKKGINFENQFKYYRNQNQTNFINNCKANGIIIKLQRQPQSNNSNPISQKTTTQKEIKTTEKQIKQTEKQRNTITEKQTKKPVIIKKQSMPKKQAKQQSENSIIDFKLGKRYGPKGKNKHILKCHQIFRQYDQKLLNGKMKDEDIEIMKSQINSELEEYMGTPDLNQTQMESQLTPIFENIKNIDDDYVRYKQKTSNNLSIDSSSTKLKNNTIKKTEQISNKKIQPPISPIQKINEVEIKQQQALVNQTKKSNSETINKKQQKTPTKISAKKTQIQIKRQIFDDDSSLMESQIKPISQKEPEKHMSRKQEQISKTNTMPQNSNKIPNVVVKESQKSTSNMKTSMKESKKGTREYFDSNMSISRSQSSRVNFSQSSNDEDSNEEDDRFVGNFKKQKHTLNLSSIAQEQMDKYVESSRRNINDSQILSTQRRNREIIIQKQQNKTEIQRKALQRQRKIDQKQRKIVVQKDSLLPSQIKVSKSAIDSYECKIKTLQQNLMEKQQREKQLSIKLNQLNNLKLHQQYELQKIKVQNSQIMERFSNAVDGQEYTKIKKDFDQMKERNKKMETQMERLLKEIQALKLIQRNQRVESHIVFQGTKQNSSNLKHQQIQKIFQSKQNLPKQNNLSKKLLEPQKPKFTYKPYDPLQKRIHFTKIHELMQENNLTLFKKNIIGSNQLFYTSEQLSFVCRTSNFKNQKMTLKLQLSFQFNEMRKKPIRPNISILNTQEVQIWKKQLEGDEDLFNLQIVVKLKKFPFSLIKIEIQWDQDKKKSVYLPLLYWNFLKNGQIRQHELENTLQNNSQSVIKSKVFNLNHKVIKDLKSLGAYKGYNLLGENKLYFKLYEQSQNSKKFWCQLTNLSKQKCILKIVPQPYSQQMVNKAQQVIQNLLFLLG